MHSTRCVIFKKMKKRAFMDVASPYVSMSMATFMNLYVDKRRSKNR